MITSMDNKINEDLVNMETKLSVYVDKGRITGAVEVREESVTSIQTRQVIDKTFEKNEKL